MRKLVPEEIRLAVRGRWRWPARTVTVEGVCTDSRRVRGGSLFVALKGDSFDGHDFLAAAAAGGCVAAVVNLKSPLEQDLLKRFAGGVIGVADTTEALGELASHCRGQMAATVVAVTGSNGKTTVKRMIDHILSRRLRGRASPGSYNNAVGVPLTLFEVAPDDDYVICELGSNAPGEIASLARIARPNVAVITSVGPAHLEKLIDLEHVAIEKASLLGALVPNGAAVVWADSPELARALRAYGGVSLIRFGAAGDAHLRLTAYEPAPGGCRLEVNGRTRTALPAPGRHNALNALAAMAVAQRFGFGVDEAAAALADFAGAGMRLEPIHAGSVTIINDAYNANPASLAAAAESLASFAGRRKVLVAGDMLELGPDSERLHFQAGRDLARTPLDVVVGVGELGGLLAAGAAEAGTVRTERIASVEAARGALPALLAGGDVVLLKGSRGMAMERLVEPIRAAFDGAAVEERTC
ncbi:MAG TPA: UDP-N-acetylmuramoyl-tripeptide--D-alanyl-D-alanine ligase [Phycisphaerae bacterium]|nr:UDP-N-acetylmuramoyl-tripeptide--D-alanyl-D-alanine ligase [Phycisphaerae bacterium]